MEIDDIGTILYWCEGSKREADCRVEFVNSDPRMIAVFLRFLRAKGIDERRLRIRMTLHVQDNQNLCKEYWKRVTSLEETNFMSTIVKPPSVSRKPLPYGTVAIRYNSLELLRAIKSDISQLVEGLEKG